MKDKNGIEICCENCDDFIPVGTNGMGCTLYEEDCETVFGGKRCVFKASSGSLEARIAELQAENALLKESRFTNNELDLIRNTFQSEIRDDKCGWSAEKKIIAKCDRILKEIKDKTMKEVTVKNYQELAMRTCLPSAKNWEYCYCLIASEIGEAFGKWGKKLRDGDFDKDKLADELGDVFWGVALACELGGYNFEELWKIKDNKPFLEIMFPTPVSFIAWEWDLKEKEVWKHLLYAKTFAEECGIDPIDCLRRNIAKLAGRKERGTIGGNGDER